MYVSKKDALITIMTGLLLSGMLLCSQFLCYNQSILENPLGYKIAISRRYPLYPPLYPTEESVSPKEDKPKDVVGLIKYYSKKYEYNVDIALKIAGCESGYRPNAKNPNSSASGVYQQLKRYRPARAKKYGHAGADVFDAEANISVSIQMMKNESTSHRNPSKYCWGK